MSQTPFLDIRQVSKTFGEIRVLHDISMSIATGEIRGLVGQNGSGKSTLIKILAGFHAPDRGAQMRISGDLLDHGVDPAKVTELGLSFIHQDLALVPGMTVLENLRVGHFQTGALGQIRWKSERAITRQMLAEVGLELDPMIQVTELSGLERALLAIARGLANIRLASASSHGHGLLVLDEPTAYLPGDDVERLFVVLRRLAAANIAILLVSHRLDEILEITDRVTILRDGQLVDTLTTDEVSEDDLISAILGQRLQNLYPATVPPSTDIALTVRGLRGARMQTLDLVVNRGAILGFTGLAGMGYEELPYLLGGATSVASGEMILRDREGNECLIDLATLTPRQAIDSGLCLLPEDRTGSSGCATMTVSENLTLPFVTQLVSAGIIKHQQERSVAQKALADFGVTPEDPDRPLGTLSGGNQQKALLAKWLRVAPDYLILHEPTQGVDVGAKKEILRRIADAAAQGTTVVVVSVEYEDLANICDRVIVIRDGAVSHDLRKNQLSTERLTTAIYGAALDVA